MALAYARGKGPAVLSCGGPGYDCIVDIDGFGFLPSFGLSMRREDCCLDIGKMYGFLDAIETCREKW